MNKTNILLEILLYLWQLPQNILGLLVILFTCSKRSNDKTYYCSNLRRLNFGVSLGNYIIFGKRNYYLDAYFHEYGHCRQSLILGWMYLIIIGIPSFIGNVYDRIAHKSWSAKDREVWYYSQLWEKWADKLGGVNRKCLTN